RCGLYLQVLEDLWEVDPGLNTDPEELGVDFSGRTDLTESEQSALAWVAGKAHAQGGCLALWRGGGAGEVQDRQSTRLNAARAPRFGCVPPFLSPLWPLRPGAGGSVGGRSRPQHGSGGAGGALLRPHRADRERETRPGLGVRRCPRPGRISPSL